MVLSIFVEPCLLWKSASNISPWFSHGSWSTVRWMRPDPLATAPPSNCMPLEDCGFEHFSLCLGQRQHTAQDILRAAAGGSSRHHINWFQTAGCHITTTRSVVISSWHSEGGMPQNSDIPKLWNLGLDSKVLGSSFSFWNTPHDI
jgi:hypothetical protein